MKRHIDRKYFEYTPQTYMQPGGRRDRFMEGLAYGLLFSVIVWAFILAVALVVWRVIV